MSGSGATCYGIFVQKEANDFKKSIVKTKEIKIIGFGQEVYLKKKFDFS